MQKRIGIEKKQKAMQSTMNDVTKKVIQKVKQEAKIKEIQKKKRPKLN